jgi:glucose/arabinose dehydrogenase
MHGRRFSAGVVLTLSLLLAACAAGAGSPTAGPTSPPAVPATQPPTAAAKPTAAATAAATPAPAVGASPTPAAKPAPTSPPAGSPAPATKLADLAAVRLKTERVAAGVDAPTDIRHAGDGSGRLFVLEKIGRVRIIKDGALLAEPFLDIREKVNARSSERGLLGIAFHPKYRENGIFFVNYSDVNGDTVVARYQVSKESADRADPASAKTILFEKQPYPNHNGGGLVFGPDGYLWIGLGDGGSGGDPQNRAQNGQTLLGKMLRIDVDRGDPYAIPPDNPFVNNARFRPEIWAYGLRNPWRYAFDRATGDLYIADVGQGQWEEIHMTPAGTPGGVNYGWNIMEGNHCFRPSSGCDQSGLATPVAEYGRDKGCSVTGGQVYRGGRIASLGGAYLFGDFCSGRLWGLARAANGQWETREILGTGMQLSTFGEDEAGEVYIASYQAGEIHRLAPG